MNMITKSIDAFRNDFLLQEARISAMRQKKIIIYCPECMKDEEKRGSCHECHHE